MKKGVYGILLLLLGLAIGGGAVLLYQARTGRVEPAIKQAAQKPERKIMYYRNPMDPTVTSPVPMKDPMGMDYVPVYEDEATAQKAGTIRISPEKIQKAGVKSATVERRNIERVIRTVGRVEPMEDKVHLITTKVPGYVEKLYVNRTDQMVAPGEKLLELYSPELVSAQQEYLLALKGFDAMKNSPYPEARAQSENLLKAARQKLRFLDISEDQIRELEERGVPSKTLAIRSPAHGSVTEKMVVEGQKIEAGGPLFKVIDHSAVWVYGEVYEYEMPYIKTGQKATLTPSYSPGEKYTASIEHIYTHLGSIRYAPEEGTEVRTAKIRFSLPNKDHRLKLGMYLNVEVSARVAKGAITVPDSAVIDTGVRQLVIIDLRDGTFEPREIKTGARGEGYYQVLSGVSPGEWVVTSANFLIDSESNLKAVVGAMGSEKKAAPQAEPQSPHAGHKH